VHYSSLDSTKIIQTIQQLRDRIKERFPTANLSKVGDELLLISNRAVERAVWVGKPNLPLRVGIGILISFVLLILIGICSQLHLNTAFSNFSDFIQAMDASFNLLVLIGAGIFFLISLEVRIKQKRALKMLHELRALAHIVDIHQLTKDPERMASPVKDTASSPTRIMKPYELSRYLDYCSEMLSLIGKVAALYAQYFDNPVVLEAVDEIEDLTTGLSRKIWQKIMIIYQTTSAKENLKDLTS
jgi:hypothetical protein